MEQEKKPSVWESLQVVAIFVSCALLMVRCNAWMNRTVTENDAGVKKSDVYRYTNDFKQKQNAYKFNTIVVRRAKSR